MAARNHAERHYFCGARVCIIKKTPCDLHHAKLSTKFLGDHLAEDLTWSLNTSTITKKAQQRLYFLQRLRKAHLPSPILTIFYRGTIVRTAEKIIGVSLPTVTDIYTTRCIRKATSIVDDHTHPSHTLFTLLPSGKRFVDFNLIIEILLEIMLKDRMLKHTFTHQLVDSLRVNSAPSICASTLRAKLGWAGCDSVQDSALPTENFVSLPPKVEELKAARHNLKAGIRPAKHKYSSQIAVHFKNNSDPRLMWQGIQVITDYKSKVSPPVTTDASLPAELNNFYARFKSSAQTQSSNTTLLPTTEEPPLIWLQMRKPQTTEDLAAEGTESVSGAKPPGPSSLTPPCILNPTQILLPASPPDRLAHRVGRGWGMFATHRSSLTELRVVGHGGRRLSRQQSFPCDPLQIPKPTAPTSGVRRSSSVSSGKLLSLSFSESMRSDIDRYLSEQGLYPLRQGPGEQAEMKGLREVRAAAQFKNLEDFLGTNGVTLQECVSYQTGMRANPMLWLSSCPSCWNCILLCWVVRSTPGI
ncbi:hypothetical protein NFI96_010072 [Prochilodus magdalenae]|nr:hypothetical protein NFI96_010072 [Prochilodus magdalenae]